VLEFLQLTKTEQSRMFERIFKEHGERVATSFFLVLALVVTLASNSIFVIWVVLGGAFMLGYHEASKLYKIEDNTGYVAAAIVWIIAPFLKEPLLAGFLPIALYAALSAYNGEFNQRKILPFIYPLLPTLLLFSLFVEGGSGYLLWLIVIIALTDTGAYFVGKAIGCTQFCKTSPKKTLEGVVGGIVIGTAGGVFVGLFFESLPLAFIISISTSIASVFGDLYESKLKREAEVKDSGNIFPGHGGILDRLDGYLFGVIPFYILALSIA